VGVGYIVMCAVLAEGTHLSRYIYIIMCTVFLERTLLSWFGCTLETVVSCLVRLI
jgi:hypothetical protein